MAMCARKGCLSVRRFREQKERRKGQKKHWEIAGTAIGNIMGVQKKEDEVEAEEEVTDYKTSQKFAQHMTDKVEASSDFAKRKTLSQQREFLPAFACRQDVKIYFYSHFSQNTLF